MWGALVAHLWWLAVAEDGKEGPLLGREAIKAIFTAALLGSVGKREAAEQLQLQGKVRVRVGVFARTCGLLQQTYPLGSLSRHYRLC